MDLQEVLTDLGAALYTHAKLAGVAEEAEDAAAYLEERGVDLSELIPPRSDEE